MDAATSKVENSAQGSSCQLKFVHAQAKYNGVPHNQKITKDEQISYHSIPFAFGN